MANKILWDETTKRFYETGVDHGFLYPLDVTLGTYPEGVAWNGLTSITEKPSGGEATPLYADNIKYLNLMSAEQFGATIEAYTYPQEFGLCDGSAEPTPGLVFGQQTRQTFGIAYRTLLGNDAEGSGYGYKLHLVYGCKASPSEKGYTPVNDSPEAIAFSWEVSTIPISVVAVPEAGGSYVPISILTIDSTRVDPVKLAALEVILYGVASETVPVEGSLPFPDEVITLMTPA